MLSDLNIKQSYRSDECNIVREFYTPCLSNSILYQRAVGYFSSSALILVARGLNALIHRGGRMQLAASPYLSEQDIEAINEGYMRRRERETQAILTALTGPFDSLAMTRLNFLAWLIEHERLDIKIISLKNQKQFGIFHEKVGLFSDGKNIVAFTGSPNESVGGLLNNFESIDVYCSWKEADRERAYQKMLNFENLWENRTRGLTVLEFPEAARQALLKYRSTTTEITDDPEEYIDGPLIYDYDNNGSSDEHLVREQSSPVPSLPSSIILRPYQQQAIENWFAAQGRGTLKMATGSGKTITALATAAKLYDTIKLQAIIIVCPYRHLVVQWNKECQRFGMQPLLCFESRHRWADALRNRLYNLESGVDEFLTVITTNSTFCGASFQACLPFFPPKTLLIGDEAHNMGTSEMITSLPTSIGLRLALSATPERWFDDSGTQKLFEYFGPVLQPEFTLKDAIEQGALVPYYYHPLFVELTDSESEEYVRLSRQIGRLLAMRDGNIDSPQLTALLLQRARLLGSAENKLELLIELMKSRLDTTHTLFYCGDGSVEDSVHGDTIRQVDKVCKILGYDLNYKVDKYTAETSLDEREDLRQRFESGTLQGLVAIRCLDEGVDIPATRTAVILASSTNPRQFIQRRGRILRRHPGKKSAEIFDMIVIPPLDANLDPNTERAIVEPEFRRYSEFASLAVNYGEARGKLASLKQRYGLLGI